MKFAKLKLSIACALAATAISGQAFATAPADPFAPAAIDAYLSGASAPQNILGGLAQTLFGVNTAGTFDHYHVYFDNGATIGASYRAYYGQLASAQVVNGVTLAANTPVLLINRAKGGSVFGVDPVARAQHVAWMPITSGNCTAASAGLEYEYTCAEQGSDSLLTGRIPDFGVSDVEPNLFKQPLNVESTATGPKTQLTAAEQALLTSFSTAAVLFGAPSTAQAASIPLSRAAFSSMLNGNITDWSKVTDTALTGKTNVVVCRRVQGSGTQATFNAYFNSWPCMNNALVGSNSLTPKRMSNSAGYSSTATTITVNAASGYTVIENPSSGNVVDCLNKADAGGTHTFTSDTGKAVTVNFDTGGYRAIGVLSFDSNTASKKKLSTDPVGTVRWDYRDLNGVTTSKTNTRNGSYDFFAEQTMQYRNDGYVTFDTLLNDYVFNYGTPAPGSAAEQKKAFIDLFITRAGDPAVLNTIAKPEVAAAVAALPIYYVPDDVTAAGLNTLKVSHGGGSCKPVQRKAPY